MAELGPPILPSIRTLPLPTEAQELFSRAVRLVKQRPDDFTPVGAWLDRHYSEATLRARCERSYRDNFCTRLRQLRFYGTRNFALSTYRRRLAIQNGHSQEQLARETIQEAHERGYRLEAILLLPNEKSYPIDYADNTAASDRTLLVRWRLVGRLHYSDRVGPPIDESNVHLAWASEDARYRLCFRQIKAERRAAELGEYDHPERRDWRLALAVAELIEAEYPDPPMHIEHSRQIAGIAALLVCADPLPLLGEFGRWEWESQFVPVGESAHWVDKVLAVDPKDAKSGPHPLRPTVMNPRSVGREEVLFQRTPAEPRELHGQWGDLSSFCNLLRVAVDELEQHTLATGNAIQEPNVLASLAKSVGPTPANMAEVPDGFYSPTDVAKAMRATAKEDAIRKALKRMLDDSRLPDGAWLENNNPAKGQARILYKLSVVRPLLARFEPTANT